MLRGLGTSRALAHCRAGICLLLLLTAGGLRARQPVADTVAVSYMETLSGWLDMRLDESAVAEVHNVTLQRDAARFFLESGTFYLAEPMGGRVRAVVFDGRGRFTFTPTTDIERRHLFRFFETETYTRKFRQLVIFFADSSESELRGKLSFAAGRIDRDARGHLRYALNYLAKKKEKRFHFGLMKSALEDARNDMFHALFRWRTTEPFFFEINPYEMEEVRFMQRVPLSYMYGMEIINQFHRQAEYADSSFLHEPEKHTLHIDHYQIDCRLRGSGLKFSAESEIRFRNLADGQRWLPLILYDQLSVDSVFWDDGSPATFIKGKDNPYLWVKARYPLAMDARERLRIHYHGKLIERVRDWFYIRSSRGWYPHHGDRLKATFDVTYRFPKQFQFASFGDSTAQDTVDNEIISRWQTSEPVRNASFNIGFFKRHRIDHDSLPSISVMMAETGHREIAHQLGHLGGVSGGRMEAVVGEDVSRSMQFFTEQFGETGLRRFFATEIPYRHGEAFPGLIHLSWLTFHKTDEQGHDPVFRAHEVAHQWWGIGVDIASYHDQWLSEAFAEFAAWRYWQEQVNEDEEDDKKFLDLLKRFREDITGNRSFLLGRGQEAAPIWLGYRTHSSETEGDYRLIIYKKGAWILHMLRTLLSEGPQMDDSRFMELMRGFYQAYRGEKASTEDFIRFAEAHSGRSLHWFFDQWVYRSGFPEYRYATEMAPVDSGYQVKLRVAQVQERRAFRAAMHIGIEMPDDAVEQVRIMTDGRFQEIDLGTFATKPKKIRFNDGESVLCKWKESDWKDLSP